MFKSWRIKRIWSENIFIKRCQRRMFYGLLCRWESYLILKIYILYCSFVMFKTDWKSTSISQKTVMVIDTLQYVFLKLLSSHMHSFKELMTFKKCDLRNPPVSTDNQCRQMANDWQMTLSNPNYTESKSSMKSSHTHTHTHTYLSTWR